MCIPTSAHEPGEATKSSSGGGTTGGSKLESFKGVVDALAAAVAAASAAVRQSSSLAAECCLADSVNGLFLDIICCSVSILSVFYPSIALVCHMFQIIQSQSNKIMYMYIIITTAIC